MEDGVRSCCGLVVKVCCYLAALLFALQETVAETSSIISSSISSSSSSSSSSNPTTRGTGHKDADYIDADSQQIDMITGLAAGFGFFSVLILCVCFVWCCCCSHGGSEVGSAAGHFPNRQRAKVSPSPPRSAAKKVRTRGISAGGPS